MAVFTKTVRRRIQKGMDCGTVPLDEDKFSEIYKAITGYDLETNNYRRDQTGNAVLDDEQLRFGFLQYAEQQIGDHLAWNRLEAYTEEHGFDSDGLFNDLMPELDTSQQTGCFVEESDSNIAQRVRGKMGRRGWMALKWALFRWKKIECEAEHELRLRDCRLVERLMVNLRAFEEHKYQIDASNLHEFDVNEVIRGFDHLISVHKIFQTEKMEQIRKYASENVSCDDVDCVVLGMHSQRKRENVDQKRSEHKEDVDEIETLCEVLSDTLSAAHCYLLHRNDDILYRLSSGEDGAPSRFSSTVQVDDMEDDSKDDEKSEADPIGVDFGVSVLKWLKYGEEPEFDCLRTEIVENEDSTIDEPMYERYLIQCMIKIEGLDFSLEELMGIKLFTDATAYQTLLRMAYWTIKPKKMKKAFYCWAKTIYRASLRHSVPIPRKRKKKKNEEIVPRPLYHGLSRLFAVTDELPIYYGPFSSTVMENVAERFSGASGLTFDIQPSYDDAETRVVGIDVATISQFKHEHEILLVNQVIPIRKAKSRKENEVEVWVNHFLFTLKSRATEVLDRKSFFTKLGIGFESTWLPYIIGHRLLFKESKFARKLMLQRLVDEFGVTQLLERYAEHYFVLKSKYTSQLTENKLLYVIKPADGTWGTDVPLTDDVKSRCLAETKYTANNRRIFYRQEMLLSGKYQIRLQNTRLFENEQIWVQSMELAPAGYTLDADSFVCDDGGFVRVVPHLKVGKKVIWGSQDARKRDRNDRFHRTNHDIYLGREANIVGVTDDSVLLDFNDKDLGKKLVKKDEHPAKFQLKWLDTFMDGDRNDAFYFAAGIGIEDILENDHSDYCFSGWFVDHPISIRSSEVLNTMDTRKVILYATKNRWQDDWFIIKVFDNPLSCASRYIWRQEQPLRINREIEIFKFSEKHKNGGKVEIVSMSDVVVTKQGYINGIGCGLQRGSKFATFSDEKYGNYIGTQPEVIETHEDDAGAGGGVIIVNSCRSIRNDGVLQCTGSSAELFNGGCVRIKASGRFENSGCIDCGVDGSVDIICTEFVNRGDVRSEPAIYILDPGIERVDVVNELIFHLMVRKDGISNVSKFWREFGHNFDELWVPHLAHHHLLLLQPTSYEGRCVLDRLVSELHVEELSDHYRVYAARFYVRHNPFTGGTFVNLYPNALTRDRAHVMGRHTFTPEAQQSDKCFEDTEYYANDQLISRYCEGVDFVVRKITAKNKKLFGTETIWCESDSWEQRQEKSDEFTSNKQSRFVDALLVNESGIIVVGAAIPANAILEVGQKVEYRHGGDTAADIGKVWTIAIVSRILRDKVCVKYFDEDRSGHHMIRWNYDDEEIDFAECARPRTFKWIHNEEFPANLRFKFKGGKISNYWFKISVGDGKIRSRDFQFEENEKFEIPLISALPSAINERELSSVELFALPSDSCGRYYTPYGFGRIATIDCRVPFPSLLRYVLIGKEPVSIDTMVELPHFQVKTASNCKLSIVCVSEMTITKQATISGNGCGISASTMYANKGVLKFGTFKTMANDTKTTAKHQVKGAGGGVVALMSSAGVINNGVVECKATNIEFFTGGSVMIATDDTFENNGVIDCGQDGVVSVECNQFVNTGSITPAPTVVVKRELGIMSWIRKNTSCDMVKRIALEVHAFGGYYGEDHHPSHLLEEGRSTHYEGSGTPQEDWIIFEVLETARFIPTKITIRNGSGFEALSQISISFGNREDTFDDWVQIQDIEDGNDEVQEFPLDEVSSYFTWDKDLKYILERVLKIRVPQRDRRSEWCEFGLYGKMLL